MATAARQGTRTYLFWGETEAEDITLLPEGWEARVAQDNRVYFVDHSEHKTQWDHPTTRQRYKVPPGLPYGWQQFQDDDSNQVFVDHIGQLRTFVDPRLITGAVYDHPDRYGVTFHTSIRNKFRSLARATEVLQDVNLSQKVAIVTGANSGLGFQTALSLAQCGAHVILACRDPVRAEQAAEKIRQKHLLARVDTMQLDLSSLRSVKFFADEFINRGLPLHILVCNAGTFGGPFSLTVDGMEKHFAVNHLGHFYLAKLLVDVMIASKPARVVVVTSESHWYPSYTSSKLQLQTLQHPTRQNYSAITAYGASKLCNLLFMLEFHCRYGDEGISCTAVHPGNLLPTNLSKNAGCMYRAAFTFLRPLTKSVEQAASTIVYCAAHPSMDDISGLYMYDCWPTQPSPEAQDPSTAAALWELSECIIAKKMNMSHVETLHTHTV